MTGLFDIPPELRAAIYNLVLDQDRILQVGTEGAGCEVDAQFYDFLRTCRTIYTEASPIFWAVNSITLEIEPSVFAPGSSDPYDLDNLGNWIARTGVRSIRSRRKIKQLLVNLWDPEQESQKSVDYGGETWRHSWMADCAKNPSRGGLDGLENVKCLVLEFAIWPADATAFPDLEEVEKLTSLRNPTSNADAMSKIKNARTVRGSTIATVKYLLSQLRGLRQLKVQALGNPAQEGLTWFGLEVKSLDPESQFIKTLRRMAEAAGCEFTVDIRCSPPFDCWLCLEPWTEGHWSPKTPKGTCTMLNEYPHNMDEESDEPFYNKWEDVAP